MMRRAVALLAVVLMLMLGTAVGAFAQDTGYEPVVPEFTESEPPPTVPPGPPDGDGNGDGDGGPPDGPSLAATGFAVTTGMAAAAGLVVGGTALVRFARRRKDDDS